LTPHELRARELAAEGKRLRVRLFDGGWTSVQPLAFPAGSPSSQSGLRGSSQETLPFRLAAIFASPSSPPSPAGLPRKSDNSATAHPQSEENGVAPWGSGWQERHAWESMSTWIVSHGRDRTTRS